MLNLDELKLQRDGDNRVAVKTFLTREAQARVKAAAAFTGRSEYQIIEMAIMAAVPEVKE